MSLKQLTVRAGHALSDMFGRVGSVCYGAQTYINEHLDTSYSSDTFECRDAYDIKHSTYKAQYHKDTDKWTVSGFVSCFRITGDALNRFLKDPSYKFQAGDLTPNGEPVIHPLKSYYSDSGEERPIETLQDVLTIFSRGRAIMVHSHGQLVYARLPLDGAPIPNDRGNTCRLLPSGERDYFRDRLPQYALKTRVEAPQPATLAKD